MPRQLAPMKRATVWMDKRGRLTVPDYMREAAELATPGWITLTAEPDLKDTRAIMIRPEVA